YIGIIEHIQFILLPVDARPRPPRLKRIEVRQRNACVRPSNRRERSSAVREVIDRKLRTISNRVHGIAAIESGDYHRSVGRMDTLADVVDRVKSDRATGRV